MGLISAIAKYAPRALKLVPDMVLGTSAEAFGKGFKAAKGSIFKDRLKAGAKAIEADVAKQTAKNGGFFRRFGKNLIYMPRDIKNFVKWGIARNKVLNRQLEQKLGKEAAKAYTKGSFNGAMKGLGKFISKRLPFLNAIAIMAFDGPAIYKKFKNEGFVAGMKETTGVATELGCMAAGTAIGSAICPGIGTIVGGVIGTFVGIYIRGKISPEKPTEEQPQEYSKEPLTQNDVKKLKEMGLGDDDIAYAIEKKMSMQDVVNIINEQKKKAEEQAATQSATTQEAQGSDALTSQTQTQKYDPDIEKVINILNRNYAQTSPMSFYSYNTPSNTYSNDMYYSKLNMGGSNPFSYNMMFNPMMMGLPYMNTSNPFMPQIPYYNMFYSA